MLAVEQQQSADAELDSHGNPHAAQAERGDEKHRETEAEFRCLGTNFHRSGD